MILTRRTTLLGGLALGACAPALTPPDDQVGLKDDRGLHFARAMHAIEQRIGGRIGVATLNTAVSDGLDFLGYRSNERFAMCSTFKWLLAAHMLWMGDRQPDFLQSRVLYNEADLLEHAPVAREHISDGPLGRMGEMTVEQMCEAIVEVSDNTCANALLRGAAMGPEGFTRFLRSTGDGVTRLDRYELELNEVPPGDERDTTTPDIMARNLRSFLLAHVELGAAPLSQSSREKLIGWMIESPTGRERLRAGLPSDWRVGDKTGTWNGATNATNDVAIAWPPGRAPIVIASYLSASTVEPRDRNAAHAEIARIVAEQWS